MPIYQSGLGASSQSKPALGKVTVRAGSNIAFIKYWGVNDPTLNLPQNNSISMTLADLGTVTTVEWDNRGSLIADDITIDGQRMEGKEGERIVRHLERMRTLANVSYRARVVSQNNFPRAAGIASSASGFAALTVAGCSALGLHMDNAPLSRLARRGSGSACRSIYGGFVEWEQGRDDHSSVARRLHSADHWDLVDVVAVVSSVEKAISSEGGHLLAPTSPFNAARIDAVYMMLMEARSALATRDLPRLGKIIEKDALAMHGVMMTSTPSLLYWQPATVTVLHAVRVWREQEGIPVYFTMDAGPNVHLICEAAYRNTVVERARALPGVQQVLASPPGGAPRQLDTHLF